MRRAACLAVLLLAATEAGAEPKLHEVRPGESLASIAARELGDAGLWQVLYRANRDRIKDPTRIYPGQRISIPTPDEQSSAAVSKASGEDDP